MPFSKVKSPICASEQIFGTDEQVPAPVDVHNNPCLARSSAHQLQIGGEFHDQVGEPLRKLWGKVWFGLPPSLGPALLP